MTLLRTLQQGGAAPEFARWPVSIATDRRGNFLVAQGGAGPPLAYDSAGRFLKTLGRQGGGPGEYRSAEILLVTENDSVVVVDRRARRMTVLTPAWEFVRSAPIPPAPFAASWTRNGRLVVVAPVADESRFGKPFHVFDRVGNYLRSFGEPDRPIIPGQTPPLIRTLSAARAGGFWTVPVLGHYLMERWTEEGARLQAVVRDVDWFPEESSPRYGYTRDLPPSPTLLSVTEDSAGLVWVMARVPDVRWKDAVRWDPKAVGEAALRVQITDYDRACDTMIEVINPATGELVLSQRFDGAWLQFIGPGKVLAIKEDQDGRPDVQVLSLALERAPQ